MKNIFLLTIKILTILLFLSAISLIFIYLVTVINGFYFTGDTISVFETLFNTSPGNLMAVVKYHYATWPPALGFAFSFLKFLPISFISQHQVYVGTIILLNIFIAYLLSRQLTSSIIVRIAFIALILFSGIQSLLFISAVVEPIYVFSWLLTIFLIERFISTKNELLVYPLILSASLIPLSRYAGIPVLLLFTLILLVFAYKRWRKAKISPNFIIVSLLLTWIPICIYLIKNYIVTDFYLNTHDPQFTSITLLDITQWTLKGFFSDIIFLGLGSLALGFQIKWTNRTKNFLLLTGLSSLIYMFFVIWIQTKFRIYDNFPSRILSVSYPIVSLGLVSFGAYIASRFKKAIYLSSLGLVTVIILFGFASFISTQRLVSEINYTNSTIPEIEHSENIRKLCRGKTPNKYLFLQDSSRNWIGQTLRYYCLPITNIPMNTKIFILPNDGYLYTPYEIHVKNLELVELYKGSKIIRVYKAKGAVNINIQDELKKLAGPLY